MGSRVLQINCCSCCCSVSASACNLSLSQDKLHRQRWPRRLLLRRQPAGSRLCRPIFLCLPDTWWCSTVFNNIGDLLLLTYTYILPGEGRRSGTWWCRRCRSRSTRRAHLQRAVALSRWSSAGTGRDGSRLAPTGTAACLRFEAQLGYLMTRGLQRWRGALEWVAPERWDWGGSRAGRRLFNEKAVAGVAL